MPSRFNTLARACAATGVTCHTRGKRFGRGLLAAVALAATIFATAPAWAQDTGQAHVKIVDSTVIRVLGDGETYTDVLASAPAISGEIDVTFSAGGSGRIREWGAWPSILLSGADLATRVQFPDLGQSESYSLGERPKRVEGDFPFSIPRSAYNDFALQACNEKALRLRQDLGMTNEEIFSQEHQLEVNVVADLTYDFSGLSGAVFLTDPRKEVGHTYIHPVIVCEKTPITPTSDGPTRTKPKVDVANLKVVGNDSNAGACSIGLAATIRTKAPNTEVKFHFESEDGNKSDTKTVVTSGNSFIQKGYTYPLSAGGMKTGQIRMVIEGESTKSGWEDYQVDCGPAANDLQTLLPPKATVLTYAVDKEVVYKGKICPTVITVIGRIDGRGKSSGTITLGADGSQLAETPFSVVGDENKSFTGKHQIVWQGKPATQQNIPLTLRVYGLKPIGNEAATPGGSSLGPLQDSLQRMVSVECRAEYTAASAPTPPVLTLSVRGGEEGLYQGYICPERVVLKGRMRGQDDFDGRAVFVVKQEQALFESQSQVKEFNFAVTENENLTLAFEPLVKWSNVPQNGEAPPKQTMDLAFRVVRNGATVASVERSLEVSCKAVSVPNLAISYDPPKVHSLVVTSGKDEILYQGRICPARVELTGAFTGQGVASGNAMLGANGRFVAQDSYDIEDGVTEIIRGEYALNWVGVQGPFKQDVEFVLRLDNAEGGEVDRMTKIETFACRKPELTRDDANRVDGLASGTLPPPPPTRPVGSLATTQTKPDVVILAPRDRVRNGQIRLSGAKPNQVFELQFLRKTNSGFALHNAPQLPAQMTGAMASFDLNALSGGDWRLRVCPKQSDGFVGPVDCENSDFYLPKRKRQMNHGRFQTQGQEDRNPARLFILPGQGG